MTAGRIDRLIGWHILVDPKRGRKVYFEGAPVGVAERWTELRNEVEEKNPKEADLCLYWNGNPPVQSGAEGWIALGSGNAKGGNARRYVLLPPENPRLVLPLDDLRQLQRGLSLHRPGRRSARIALHMLSGVVGFGLTRPLTGRVLWISDGLPQGAIAGVSSVLYLGTEDRCRKTTILPKHAGTLLKHATGDEATRALRTETYALEVLAGTGIADRIPKVVAFHELTFGCALEQEYRTPIGVGYNVTDNDVIEFLVDMAAIDAQTRGGVLGHRCHGDFAPWNMMKTSQGLFVYDWENSRSWAPALSDAFYFAVAPFLYVKGPGGSSHSAIKRAKYLGEEVARAIGLPESQVQMLLKEWLLGEQKKTCDPFLVEMIREIDF